MTKQEEITNTILKALKQLEEIPVELSEKAHTTMMKALSLVKNNCVLPDVSNSALLEIKNICETTEELPANFNDEQARNCDDALNQIMRIVDDLV